MSSVIQLIKVVRMMKREAGIKIEVEDDLFALFHDEGVLWEGEIESFLGRRVGEQRRLRIRLGNDGDDIGREKTTPDRVRFSGRVEELRNDRESACIGRSGVRQYVSDAILRQLHSLPA